MDFRDKLSTFFGVLQAIEFVAILGVLSLIFLASPVIIAYVLFQRERQLWSAITILAGSSSFLYMILDFRKRGVTWISGTLVILWLVGGAFTLNMFWEQIFS